MVGSRMRARIGTGPRRMGSVAAAASVTALLLTLALAGSASAHAKYSSSDPAANAVLKAPPSVVTVHFLENVSPDGSSLTVYDAKGKVVSDGQGQVSAADVKTMTVGMTGDGSEIYLVVWKTVSLDDGDADIGAFNFFIGNDAAPARSGNSTTASAAGSGGAAATPGWAVALVGIAGLVVGAGGMYFARRASR